MPVYRKLVRDRVPELLAERGMNVRTRRLTGAELLAALRTKLDEELAEFDEATSDEQALAELADVLEVIDGVASRRGWSPARLAEARALKARERGTFSLGIELIEAR